MSATTYKPTTAKETLTADGLLTKAIHDYVHAYVWRHDRKRMPESYGVSRQAFSRLFRRQVKLLQLNTLIALSQGAHSRPT